MVALAGTQATAGSTEKPVRLESRGRHDPQAAQALLELLERVLPQSQTMPWVPARTPKRLSGLKAYASRRSLLL
jgi:hypothetical protein